MADTGDSEHQQTTNDMAKAAVAILSIGDMGVGIARLLASHDYKLITNVSGRSEATQRRAQSNGIETVASDEELVNSADYVLSIVPQKDALSIAQRIIAAANSSSFAKRQHPLFFLDLNAVSPETARKTAKLFAESAPAIKLIDGGIISGPPRQQPDGTWFRPRIVVSGPVRIDEGPGGQELAATINLQHVDDKIGAATGLKCCFAALLKGFGAIAIQSFTTAERLGVTDNLQELLVEYAPATGATANRMLPGIPPKAYRWDQEMLEISEAFAIDGGFSSGQDIFGPMSRLFSFMAHETVLGEEKIENRRRGTTAEDVARVMAESVDQAKATDLK